jgi:Fic-DOC domain mobile mystery protein B
MTLDLVYPEGATPLSDEEKEGLRLPHVTNRSELNLWEQRGIIDAEKWAFRRKPERILSEEFIRELHRRMFGKVWKWSGTWRKSDKNIGGPWWRIGADLRDLCADALLWVEHGSYPPDEIAARLHHRLVSIHCFPNGNGRHARLLADLVLVHLLVRERFSWGGENLVDAGECRRRYIAALHAADRGDYGLLLEFVRS